MNTTTPTIGATVWYESPVMISQVVTFLSATVAIAPKFATALGLTSTDAINQTVTAVFGVIALLATAYGAVKRAKSTTQPLTLTQGSADVHPATLVANSTAVTNQRNANIAAVQKAQAKVTP
jgi:hypothetical protein